jgi:GNAT superfamily N-acetyltransferase
LSSEAAVAIRVDPAPGAEEFSALWQAAWGTPWTSDTGAIWSRSLAHLGAYAGERLIGYLNLAWDGGIHAFLLDTTVHPEFQRRGVATRLVQAAVAEARRRGPHWLHVDYEPHLESFYQGCGFRPTLAGLIRLKD